MSNNMVREYNAVEVEKKWRKKWAEDKLYEVDIEGTPEEDKFYNLTMFPYPSGSNLHMGHWLNYGGVDTFGRYMRLTGKTVFQPMGFDSFGLPAENYAIKTGVHPEDSISTNVATMKKQISEMGGMWDWSKQVITSSPEYYKWTQWLFLKMLEEGLAYQAESLVNWDPVDQTVLANEQVLADGTAERSGAVVEKKLMKQWYFKITDFAEDLLDFSGTDWPEKTRKMQENWIGKSEGTEIVFDLLSEESAYTEKTGESLVAFSTRADTLYGATYMVVAPEHPMVDELLADDYREQCEKYIKKALMKNEIERSAEGKEKTGVFTGSYAENPINGKPVPIWVADYVIGSYGTGAIMAVPAHDKRDYEFAKKYKLDIVEVVDGDKGEEEIFTGYGIAKNSGEFDGEISEKVKEGITAKLEQMGKGSAKVTYRLRDWSVSRQRYWGAPIPVVYCDDCGVVPVPVSDLPVELPRDVDYQPKGKAPLATSEEFVNCKCPSCGGAAKRETDTLDTFVCSSWYYLRYPNANDDTQAIDKALAKKWTPIDMYIGGSEHATMHLLYVRFVNMVMKRLGYVDHKEPTLRLFHQGLITKDGAKMSKSKGNVVNPDEYVEKHGSDVLKMYLMFMGPFSDGGDWSDTGITGVLRFRDKFWKMLCAEEVSELDKEVEKKLHKVIDSITTDMQNLQFNTCLSALMEFTNLASKKGLTGEAKEKIVTLISPLAPHMAEEIWIDVLGHEESLFAAGKVWPEADPEMLVDDVVTLGVQVNGKLRGEVDLAVDEDRESALEKSREVVAGSLEGKDVVKEIYVPGKIINFVVK
jgi:leucyl-tRNA synthetase